MAASTAFDTDLDAGGTAGLFRSLGTPSRLVAFALGDGDRIFKANDDFLEFVGYSLDDLLDGNFGWRHLAPPHLLRGPEPEQSSDSSVVHVVPFRRELVRKDGERIIARISVVILNTAPFRWFATVQPLSLEDSLEIKQKSIRLVRLGFEDFIGACAPIERVMELVRQVAPTDATTMILGETGTGKELVARAVHRLSRRSDFPFVTLNCAALPAGILESELFGHERGAFTNAHTKRIGRFELAHNGTLFLDEVGDLPVDLQPKLLRALQEGTFERLGGNESISVNVRVIAATNRDLTSMIAERTFRNELYYRLNVFPITTPSLRERGEDVLLLIQHFTQHYAKKLDREVVRIPKATLSAMVAWEWPGNVRELENFIFRSVILTRGKVLEAPIEELRLKNRPMEELGLKEVPMVESLDETKRRRILRVLTDCNGVVKTAAERLGMPRTTMIALMRRLEIHRSEFL